MLSLSHKNHHATTLSSLHSVTSSGDDGDGELNQQRHPRIMSWLITRSCFPSRLHNIIAESSIVKLELFLKISRPLQFEYSTLRARYIHQVHILQARPNWWCWCRWWWEEGNQIGSLTQHIFPRVHTLHNIAPLQLFLLPTQSHTYSKP